MALALCGSTAAAQTTSAPPQETTSPPSKFRSSDDGWFDVSGFLDEKYGFLPLIIPITEPAVGHGAVGALAFLNQPSARRARASAGPTSRSPEGPGPKTARGACWSATYATGSTT